MVLWLEDPQQWSLDCLRVRFILYVWHCLCHLSLMYSKCAFSIYTDPPDTIKSRLQVQGAGGGEKLYVSSADAFIKVRI